MKKLLVDPLIHKLRDYKEKQRIQEYINLLRCDKKQHETNGLSLHFSQLKSFHEIRLKNKCWRETPNHWDPVICEDAPQRGECFTVATNPHTQKLKSLVMWCTKQLRTLRHIATVLTKVLSKDIELTLEELLKPKHQPHDDVMKGRKRRALD